MKVSEIKGNRSSTDTIQLIDGSTPDTIELLESTDNSSTVKSFLDKKGNGLHHIALEVDNIYNAIEYLECNNIKTERLIFPHQLRELHKCFDN